MRASMSPFRASTSQTPRRVSTNASFSSFTFPFSPSLFSPEGSFYGFQVYNHRFVNLALLSLLNFLSDWQCFSFAPIAHLAEEQFEGLQPEFLVSIFLLSNFIATLIEPKVVQYFGLRGCVTLGSMFLALGSLVKSGTPLLGLNYSSRTMVRVGTVLIGLSQPMYQCTPALLSSTWFPHDERTIATAIALNSNQLGIGASFAMGAIFVDAPTDVPVYFALLGVFALILFLGVLLEFEEAPPTPPSHAAAAAAEKRDKMPIDPINLSELLTNPQTGLEVGEMGNGPGYDSDDSDGNYEELSYSWDFLRQFFIRPGFIHSLIAFATSAVVINTVSTYMNALLAARGRGRVYVGVVGAVFQLTVMFSSFVIGGYTDRKRNYFTVTISLLISGALMLAVCAHALDENSNVVNIWWMLLVIAATVGPLQPIATELGCEVVYPHSENVVLVLQQLAANLCSAAFVPFFEEFKDLLPSRFPRYGVSFLVLTGIHAIATIQFTTFNGTYERYRAELKRKKSKRRKQERGSFNAVNEKTALIDDV